MMIFLPTFLLLVVVGESQGFVPSSYIRNNGLSHGYGYGQAVVRSSSNSQEDMSGGIFFDGPTDFKDWTSTSASSNKLRLQGNSKSNSNSNSNSIPKDVVIIGAGLAGLSTALHISLNSNRQVTILEKEDPIQQRIKTPAASFAAAGMLAPHSERLPSGPLLDLCLQSRELYADFVASVESIACKCSPESMKYLWNNDDKDSMDKNNGLEPWEVGFAATGGFLAPAFAGDSVATWSPPAQVQSTAMWLDEIQVHEMEPSLHPDVIGGWWFPEDASVDARRLTCALRAACMERGVQFMWGEGCGVGSLELGNGKCKGLRLNDGRVLSAKSVVVANGSWMRNLLPVPVTPHKGQSFSLRMPKDTEPLLSRILFAQDTYIVPKADGRIVIGATVEVGTFDCDVTPSGMMHCMANALQLVPGLADLPVEETWAGLRPTTPDKGPILGRTKWDNLFLAGGYWRNGVLLAPKTGQLIADLVINDGKRLCDENDESLLEAFNWDRFTSPEGGKSLAANARYAASMHPVHKRSSGVGIAASVGTELGFYSGADAAKEERKRGRKALFQDLSLTDEDENAFEKAAKLGLSDATAFASFGEAVEKPRIKIAETEPSTDGGSNTEAFDGCPDALTVGYGSSVSNASDSSSETDTESNDLSLNDIYVSIQKKKAEILKDGVIMDQSNEDKKPDPGFRIHHVEKGTKKVREVPPYTSPSEFFASISNEDGETMSVLRSNEEEDEEEITQSAPSLDENEIDEYDETTYDGYQTIQKANSRQTREEELIAMKKARMSNRIDVSMIERSNIGVFKYDEFGQPESKLSESQSASTTNDSKDLTKIYDQILSNKKNTITSGGVQMESAKIEDRPDPGFRVYHVDKETRAVTEVPPYTSPGEHLQSLESKKMNIESNNDEIQEEQAWGE